MNSFTVQPEQDKLRLDQFLAEANRSSRKKAKALIDAGRVYQGERKVIIGSWEVHAGETWTVHPVGNTPLPRRQRYLKVYYEDSSLLVVEKPPGVACERTAQTLSSTLVDDINDYLTRAHPEVPFHYVGLMHRLDRETSGLMVYTLRKEANSLSEQFKRHSVSRRYLAMVEGSIAKAEGKIESVLVKDTVAGGKKMKALRGQAKLGGRAAITHYRVVERYPRATLVEAVLETGRTHQVRVHLASLGHPVIGDKLYGSKISVGRHLLHASHLEFRHPLTGKRLKFTSKPPKDFAQTVEKFRKTSHG